MADAGPGSPPCPSCHQPALERHLGNCPVLAVTRRPFVPATAAERRWRFRPRGCGVWRRQRWRCRGHATLWLVGPRGGILGRWCASHEQQAVRTFLRQHPSSRGQLYDADYQLRSSEEELVVWAIAHGPDVRLRPYG